MKHLICILALVGSASAFAHEHDGKDKHPPVTKAERETMAAVHEKMAACLRSDKTIDACHEEMHGAMKDMGTSCPMMEGHGKGHKDHKDK